MSDDIQTPEADQDDAYALESSLVRAVRNALDDAQQDRLRELLEPLHEADIADLIEQINSDDRERLVDLWGDHLDASVLSELEEGVRDEILSYVPPEILSKAVRDLDTDDVVYLIEDLEEPQQEKLLEALPSIDRLAVAQSLQYPDYTAGRMMQRELVLAPTHWNVGEIIDFMRSAEDLPDMFYDVIIVDERLHPVGTVPLSAIMAAPRARSLKDLMHENFRVIPVEQRQEDVAYAFNQYHMVSAPVVDEGGRLVGVITIDDAMDVLEDEAEEDMKRLAGLGDEELSDKVWETTKLRFPWLAVNLVTSIIASIVIAQFADTIEAIVALAVLMPIVASMGGNAGTQTLTVAVRALATRDLTPANAYRIIMREAWVGLLNGFVFAIIIGFIGFVWYGEPMLGVVLGMAMVGNLLVAGVAGILIPIGLEKLGADPALASGAFVTTVTDVVGFFAFLGLAGIILL